MTGDYRMHVRSGHPVNPTLNPDPRPLSFTVPTAISGGKQETR
jgi:hypothetical protein